MTLKPTTRSNRSTADPLPTIKLLHAAGAPNTVAHLTAEALSSAFALLGCAHVIEQLYDRPYLFSQSAIVIHQQHWQQIHQLIRIIESIQQRSDWVSPGNAASTTSNGSDTNKAVTKINQSGLFCSYDFHLTANGPALIEINTNAGGALLNIILQQAWRSSCAVHRLLWAPIYSVDDIIHTFAEEWALHPLSAERALKTIAIVDLSPATQYLYPEFAVCHSWLTDAGYRVHIADASDLVLDAATQALYIHHERIDLIYNRLTDFMLDDAVCQPIKTALAAGTVVVSPSPATYQQRADKSHLIHLTSEEWLATSSLAAQQQEILRRMIPKTEEVPAALCRESPTAMEQLWKNRQQWFFKPKNGYGSRAAYRGDKLTRRVFQDILQRDDYIMQKMAAPLEFPLTIDGNPEQYKFDIRVYVTHGQIIAAAARIFQGQTVNFRNPGGGFAPLLIEDAP